MFSRHIQIIADIHGGFISPVFFEGSISVYISRTEDVEYKNIKEI